MGKQAFAAMKGLYDDGHGNFTVRRAPNRDYAIRLLHSDEYSDVLRDIKHEEKTFYLFITNDSSTDRSCCRLVCHGLSRQ